MSREQHIAAQERLGQAISSGQLDALDDIFAPTVVDHDPAPDQGPGPAGFKGFFTTLRAAFPDLTITPAHVVTDEDNVAIAYTISGTHQGDFLGVAPTGKRISARGVQIGWFENGQIVERWGSSDELGILHQLGVTPERVVVR